MKISVKIDNVDVIADIYIFPKALIKKGVENFNRHKDIKTTQEETIEQYEGLKLLCYKSKWWLYYPKGNRTGSFESKYDAVNWFLRCGR